MRKPSFFERLTGSISPENYDDLFESESRDRDQRPARASALAHDQDDEVNDENKHRTVSLEHDAPDDEHHHVSLQEELETEEEPAQEGELAVDIYQTGDAIVVKALIAGVNPNSVDISLTRDMITIRGHREEHTETTADNYFYKELYWGAFARTILLPEEVDVDAAEATTNHGILIIRLPKINKERQTKLKVKASSSLH